MANGFDLCNGTIFRIRWKIDVLFNEAKPRGGGGGGGEAEYIYAKYRTISRSTISHLGKIQGTVKSNSDR